MLDATINAIHPSGFTIEIHLQNKGYDELDATIDALEQLGYRPTTGAGEQWARTPTGEPICPKHQVVMRLRQKQHEEWWSHRVINRQTGEELYCKGSALLRWLRC
jgi:hypothetical protein